ncbi:MAG: RHS repeat-associated core domain-containing protein [Saprospiraceae bacterium]|nr:RHS repeat-associated core domain-containing protein [Saprospiraceae bacterium]
MDWHVANFNVNGNSLSGTRDKTKYTYNGKEYLEDLNINLHDYGARYYDPSIARWTSVDPLSKGYAPISSYCYVMNNPITFVDPDGMKVEYADNVNDKTKNKINQLKEDSEAFAFLFNLLDNLKDEDGNDVVFTITGGKPRDMAGGAKMIGGSTKEIGGEIFLSTESSNSTISEEFFHKFQALAYGVEDGKVGDRRNNELDAEAKLFNSIVTGESSDDRILKPDYEERLHNPIFKKVLKEKGYQIQVTARSVDVPAGLDESLLSAVYRRYLADFRDKNKNNPAYAGP